MYEIIITVTGAESEGAPQKTWCYKYEFAALQQVMPVRRWLDETSPKIGGFKTYDSGHLGGKPND